MSFNDKYTTTEKIAADKTTEKTEEAKTTLSNDAYALGEMVECLKDKIEKLRLAIIR
ncbi:hypothetical protein M0R04_15800 [Candidatus Dojkabacteria bacterium]|jgi:hypothetical protein|nr:hypothetical protein [Candidatus Dojkabacteria bacterium]